MTWSLSDVAARAGVRVVRDAEFDSVGFLTSRLDRVLAAVSAPRYLAELGERERFAAIVATPELENDIPARYGLAIADKPVEAMFRLHLALGDEGRWGGRVGPTRIDPSATVHPTAVVAERDVTIGPGTVIGPRAVIHPRVEIGEDCHIHAGAVLGSEGYEVRVIDGARQVVPHVGGVRIGDRVDVMVHTVVCASLFGGDTEVGDDTKIDNLVHVAHDVKLGRRCRIVAHAMLGGSATFGDDVWVGPNASVSNSLTIGDRAFITLGSVVTRNVPADAHVTGNFAIDHRRWIDFVKSVR